MKAVGLVLLLAGMVGAQSKSDPSAPLAAAGGRFVFGPVAFLGIKVPFMLDTQTGRLWRYYPGDQSTTPSLGEVKYEKWIYEGKYSVHFASSAPIKPDSGALAIDSSSRK